VAAGAMGQAQHSNRCAISSGMNRVRSAYICRSPLARCECAKKTVGRSDADGPWLLRFLAPESPPWLRPAPTTPPGGRSGVSSVLLLSSAGPHIKPVRGLFIYAGPPSPGSPLPQCRRVRVTGLCLRMRGKFSSRKLKGSELAISGLLSSPTSNIGQTYMTARCEEGTCRFGPSQPRHGLELSNLIWINAPSRLFRHFGKLLGLRE
jgi:hypothetical protein